jgi:hypothetical protein
MIVVQLRGVSCREREPWYPLSTPDLMDPSRDKTRCHLHVDSRLGLSEVRENGKRGQVRDVRRL